MPSNRTRARLSPMSFQTASARAGCHAGAPNRRDSASAPTGPWPDDPAHWWRRLCAVTPQVMLCGDLHPDPRHAVVQLHEWVTEGVTHILDVRSEFSDERTVAAWAPQLAYHWLGTEDHGQHQDPAWFDAGVGLAKAALQRGDARIVVHCHMGINRGPSMALAVLLSQGWDCIAALNAIRAARPIAAVIYAADAVTWWHTRKASGRHAVAADQARVQAWFTAQNISPPSVRRLVRSVG
jgi:dual specificity phosphatase 3